MTAAAGPSTNVFPQRQVLAAALDATLLRPDVSPAEIKSLARQARHDACASVCVAPAQVAAATQALEGSVTVVAATVSFPHGSSTLAAKSFEALEAIRLGARELDIVCDLGAVRRGDIGALEREMAALMERTPEASHKFIVEVDWLPKQAWKRLGRALQRLAPAFVKTGTGVNAGPVTVDQVQRLVDVCRGAIPIKAAGGIRTLHTAAALVQAGASRLGTSAAAALLAEWDEQN